MSSRYLLLTLLFFSLGHAQDTLKLSTQNAEAIFLRENLMLIAERLEIPKSEALVLQAKLWPNPNISIEDVNLWKGRRGTNNLEYFGEELPAFGNGNFGKHQQVAASIEQLILTAGKRKKLMALEQVTVDRSKQYFEELLRNLKLEFRNNLSQLQYLQASRDVYQGQISAIRQLTNAYQNQVTQGNVPKGEYVRLKALELEFSKSINDLTTEISEAQKELKILMRLPAHLQLVIDENQFDLNTSHFKIQSLQSLLDDAESSRPDAQLAALDLTYYSRLLAYEKSMRTPDVTLKGAYDRGGNLLYNFVGFGLSMDLPVFNRNQGNVKFAKIGAEQSNLLFEQKILTVRNEIAQAYQNLQAAVRFYESIEPGYEVTLDDLLASYTKNFTTRNISLLEFLDFVDAYLENKKIILEAGKEINVKAEELNYSLGRDLIR